MKCKTIGTVFSGIGGVEQGAKQAGIEPLWGIEIDEQTASVNAMNFDCPVYIEDAQKTYLEKLERPNILWASPPCQHWSQARQKRGDLADRHDKEVGLCLVDYIEVMQPDTFIMENVTMFRKSHSFQEILKKLLAHRYTIIAQPMDAVNFGVPQFRKRLIFIANKCGLMRPLPKTEHRGWWSALEDIWEHLPEEDF